MELARPGKAHIRPPHRGPPPALLDGCHLGVKHLRMGLRLPTLSPRWGTQPWVQARCQHLWPMSALSGD